MEHPRVFFDHMIPRQLRAFFPDPSKVHTARWKNWNLITNGSLLKLVASEYDIFVTGDKNIPSQQELSKFDIAYVELSPFSWGKIQDMASKISQQILKAQKGYMYTLNAPFLSLSQNHRFRR